MKRKSDSNFQSIEIMDTLHKITSDTITEQFDSKSDVPAHYCSYTL